MHYEALPPDSTLSQAMLAFTEAYTAHEGQGFTGHLSFDFMVNEGQIGGKHSIRKGEDPVLYPIECNPRAHTAVVLFSGHHDLVDAYLSLVQPLQLESTPPIMPRSTDKYFWQGHDLVELVILPMLAILFFQSDASLAELLKGLRAFFDHILFWRDGTFERWDPLPWWWLYHECWPMRFWQSLISAQAWSRINCSTMKMFEC